MTNTDNSAHGYSEGSECVDCAKEKHELRQEIANHIAVNSLLTDSDGEADLANKLFKAQEEIQQLKEALKEILPITEDSDSLGYLHVSEKDYPKELELARKMQKSIDKARKLIELKQPEK